MLAVSTNDESITKARKAYKSQHFVVPLDVSQHAVWFDMFWLFMKLSRVGGMTQRAVRGASISTFYSRVLIRIFVAEFRMVRDEMRIVFLDWQ
jgi:hypothetical protein